VYNIHITIFHSLLREYRQHCTYITAYWTIIDKPACSQSCCGQVNLWTSLADWEQIIQNYGKTTLFLLDHNYYHSILCFVWQSIWTSSVLSVDHCFSAKLYSSTERMVKKLVTV